MDDSTVLVAWSLGVLSGSMVLAFVLRLVGAREAASAKLVQFGGLAAAGLLIGAMLAGGMSWWLVALIVVVCVVGVLP